MKKIAILMAAALMCVALTSCSVMIEILDSMLEHPHEYTYTLEPGDEAGTFDLVGRCPYEYCENPTYTEKNVEVYISSAIEGNCLEGSKTVYSHDFEGGTVSYTLETAKGEHKLCGVPVSKFYINGSMIDSSVPGVTLASEATAKCGGTADATYICDTCGATASILAYVSHKGVWSVTATPTCTTDGREVIDCERCLTHVERTIEAYGHDHELSVVQNNDGTSNILCSCKVAGCSFKGLSFNNVQGVVEVSATEPTCTEPGSRVYNYTKNGELLGITITMRPLEHFLNGDVISASLNADGSLDYGIKGVSVINKNQLVCGNLTKGYYCCESCDTPVLTSVYVRPHTLESRENWIVTAPTCQSQGRVIKNCKYCDYKITETTSNEELGNYHSIEWTVTMTGTDISAALSSGNCKNTGCTYSANAAPMDAGSYSCKSVSATCTKAGEILHSWTVNGAPVQYKTTNLTTGHMIADNDGNVVPVWSLADENGYFDYALDSIHLFAGGSISCGNTASANYRCAVCNEVSIVTAIQHHTMAEYSTVAPGCTTDGYKLLKCSSCGVQDSTLIPASHTLEYVHDIENNTLTYKCVKGSSDCTYSETTVNLSTGNLAVRRIITPSTCCEYGVAEYTFFYLPSGASESVSINFTGKLALSSHMMKDNSGNIVSADTLCDKNGYFDSSLNSVRYFAGGSAPAEGSTTLGYYKCEKCGEMVQITIKNNGN